MVRVEWQEAVDLPAAALIRGYRAWLLRGPPAPRDPSEPDEVRVEDRTIRISRGGTSRRGHVRVEVLATFADPRTWDCRREIELEGRPYLHEVERYRAEERSSATLLSAEIELRAGTGFQNLALELGRHRIRRQRQDEVQEWVRLAARVPPE